MTHPVDEGPPTIGPISAKVAQVLGPRELIMNKGWRDGVAKGMRFAVLDLRANDVSDPDTGENLGSLYLEKVRVEAIRVEERIALARTYERLNVGVAALGMSRLFTEGREYVTFARPSEMSFDLQTSIVQRGDLVQQIFDAPPKE